jgi:hypothetical protein
VWTIKDLRRRNAIALTAKLVDTNGRKQMVRRLPTLAMVEGWIEAAVRLDPAVR